MLAAVLASCALAAALAPGTAGAATLYVDEDATTPASPCTNPTPANACLTIGAAITQARGTSFPGGDTIVVAPGTYGEQIVLNDDDDNGNVIDGAGTSSSPATGTIIRRPAGAPFSPAVLLGFTAPPFSDDLTLKDVRVEMPASAPNDARGVQINATNSAIDNVDVSMQSATSVAAGIGVDGGPTVIDRASVSGVTGWSAEGMRVQDSFNPGTPLLIRDSTLNGGGSGVNHQALSTGRPTTVLRSRLMRPTTVTATGTVVLATDDITIDSSRITGGERGFGLLGNTPTHATLRNTTIDVRQLGVANDAGMGTARSISAFGSTGSGAATIDVESSIAVERQDASVGGGANPALTSITCSRSDLPDQAQTSGGAGGAISCASGANGNAAVPPGDNFLNWGTGDYRLKPTAPAVDSGAPDSFAGESPTDADGNQRVLDGNLDCVARRDRGAYELTGFSNSPPVPAIAAPAGATAGTAVDFQGSASDEDPPEALSFGWAFSDGATATGALATHAFGATGPADATLTVADSHGCTGTATHSLTVEPPTDDGTDRISPLLDRVSVKNSVFAPRPQVTRSRGALRVRRGTAFLWRLSEPASVAISIRRCVPKPAKPRRCKRWKKRGNLTTTGRQGTNKLPFSGHLRGKPLRPSRYRAALVGTDAAGNSSDEGRVRFKVVAP